MDILNSRDQGHVNHLFITLLILSSPLCTFVTTLTTKISKMFYFQTNKNFVVNSNLTFSRITIKYLQ